MLAITATNGQLVTQLGNICGNLIAVAADSSYTLEAEEINEEPVIVPPVIDPDNSFTIDPSEYETDHLDHLDDAGNYAVTPANESGSFVIDFNAELSSGYTFMCYGTTKKQNIIIENATGRRLYLNKKPGYYACGKKGVLHDNCPVTYVASPNEVLFAKYTTGVLDEDEVVNFQLEYGEDLWESKQKRGKQRHTCEENPSNIYIR